MAFSPAPTLPRAVANRIPSIPPEPSLFFAPLPSFGQRSTPVVRLMGSSWGSKPTFRASLWPYRQKLYSPKIGKQNRKQKQKPEQRPEHSGGSNLKSTISQKSTVASRLRQAVSAGQGMELVASPTVSSRSSRTSSPPPQRRADQMHTQPATSPRLPLSRFTTTTRYYQATEIEDEDACRRRRKMQRILADIRGMKATQATTQRRDYKKPVPRGSTQQSQPARRRYALGGPLGGFQTEQP